MKFLLVTSLRREVVKVWVCQETSPVGSLLPPVDLASIAAVIRAKGHDVKIADLRLERDAIGVYLETIETFQPDAILLNLTTTGAESEYTLIGMTPRHVKKIAFGTHAQSMHEEAFRKGVDFVLLGDPETGVSNLIEHNLDGESAAGVLTSRRHDKPPARWDDLDTMPLPALDLIDNRRYHSSIVRRGKRFTLLLGSRGCPFACTYCLYPTLFGSDNRTRGVKNIVDEMERDQREFGIDAFYFLDATFNLKKSRVVEFANEIIERGLKVEWSCNMRVSPVDTEMLTLMKKAGCDWVFYGVEDQDFLVETKKGTTREATLSAFAMTKAAGIKTIAFTMIFPRPGVEENSYANDILRMLDLLGADAFQCNISIPFPGTEMYDDQVRAGTADQRWRLYDPHGHVQPYECDVDLVRVKQRIYRGFMRRHPLRTLRVAGRMGLKALAHTAWTFGRENLLGAIRPGKSSPRRSQADRPQAKIEAAPSSGCSSHATSQPGPSEQLVQLRIGA
jgi:radical SAM superfamily enzyme YgiQ (UPF0313 family)